MALKTKGFADSRRLGTHFQEHGGDFGASNAIEYEAHADMFLSGQCPAHVHEFIRSKGDIMRYDPMTEAFGVLGADGVIRTFLKPLPCSKVPISVRSAMRLSGRCHEHVDNLTYFQAECKKW
jgi:pyocin large subunit-like protein